MKGTHHIFRSGPSLSLNNNKYPESFVYPILNSTISKLVYDGNFNSSNNGDDDLDTVSLDSNACLNVIADKDTFLFLCKL